jgi:type IV pilus assembly protein PilB
MTDAGHTRDAGGSPRATGRSREVDLLRSNPLFEGLPPSVLGQLAERLLRQTLAAGEDLVPRHEEAPGFFLVESGRIAAVVRNLRAGTTQVVATVGPPHGVGALWLVSPAGRAAADVEYMALRSTVVHLLPADVFDALLRQVPSFALAVARSVAAESAEFVRHGAVPWSDLASHTFDERLWACLPVSLASSGRVCPLELTGDTMTVAMVDPREVAALDELSTVTPGVRFRIVACSAEEMRRFIGAHAARRESGLPPRSAPPADGRPAFRFLGDETAARDPRRLSAAPAGPAVSAIDDIVGAGLTAGASDIHIEPERQGVVVRYRVDGALQRRPEAFALDLAKPIAIRLKSLARLDITETRRPQDGRISVQLANGRLVDLRLSTVPAKFGEKVALRILDSGEAIADLKSLFLIDQVRSLFARYLARRTGFVLVTGPTGSGKSTTLYSALNACRAQHLNIMTVEDPIEYHLDGVTQVEVHPEAGTTFATVLRALLRQDPNIILVGEMRDAETARIAVEASLTGHLVLSSLHTNGALEAIARMRDLGIEPYALANGLLAVVHQRLVQRVCAHCAETFDYPSFVLDALERRGALPSGQRPPLVRGKGCPRCRGTGLAGRTMVCGILNVNDDVRDAIGRRAGLAELREAAARGPQIDLHQYAGTMLAMGLTVPGEVLPLLQTADDA